MLLKLRVRYGPTEHRTQSLSDFGGYIDLHGVPTATLVVVRNQANKITNTATHTLVVTKQKHHVTRTQRILSIYW